MTTKIALMVAALVLFTRPGDGAAKATVNHEIQPIVVTQFLEKAKKNNNWKIAFITGKHGQIVFMNVSSQTNSDNEIGMEDHSFDQFIFIVEGNGKAILGKQTSVVKEGDIIFIPQGTPHNIINLDQEKGLKLISFYSENDIPSGAVYEKKADALTTISD